MVDYGFVFLHQTLTAQNSWIGMGTLALGAFFVQIGYREMIQSLQSLEVDELAITHQFSTKIIRVRWNEIKTYVLNHKRFIAIGKQSQILLDLNLQRGWPFRERAQFRQWIERKMNEVGATRETLSGVPAHHAIKIKP